MNVVANPLPAVSEISYVMLPAEEQSSVAVTYAAASIVTVPSLPSNSVCPESTLEMIGAADVMVIEADEVVALP